MPDSILFDKARVVLKTWFVSFLLIPACAYLIFNRGNYIIIDNADLVIHEAGHFFFMFFGKYIYTLGGTLMQVLLPSLIVWYFLKSTYKTGVQISLLWLGQNFINISVYSADARAMRLPLLGGSHVYHDWNYLLKQAGLLEYDIVIGYLFFSAAIVIFVAAILTPLFIKE